MDPLFLILIGTFIAGLFTLVLYLVSDVFLKKTAFLAPPDDMQLKRELFQCGEAISSRERRYLSANFYWVPFYFILRVIVFVIASMLVLSFDVLADNAVLALIYIGIGFLASFLLTTDKPQPNSMKRRD